jgi:radical SAM superfamily enzyme YgiQ (UPF0313 family)
MRTRVIHLVNPKTDSLTTRPLYMNRALYSPLAGLLAVAAAVPRERYEVVLTDENIEAIDFDLKADLVGISAMTSYVNRGYEIADAYRARGIPVVMGGVHPSFMPQESLKHCDAVVIGEVELVIDAQRSFIEMAEINHLGKCFKQGRRVVKARRLSSGWREIRVHRARLKETGLSLQKCRSEAQIVFPSWEPCGAE